MARFDARDSNATKRPSAESEGRALYCSPCAPDEATLTRVVTPAATSRTNTSSAPLVSPATRSGAPDEKATKRPSAETAGSALPRSPVASAPDGPTLTRVVTPVRRSYRKTSTAPLVSPGTRASEREANATKRPLAESAGGIGYAVPGSVVAAAFRMRSKAGAQ